MSPNEAFRFVLWAQSHRCEGALLPISAVMDRWSVSRPTAYRLMADYFDARCWSWPRPRETVKIRIKGDGSNPFNQWKPKAAA